MPSSLCWAPQKRSECSLVRAAERSWFEPQRRTGARRGNTAIAPAIMLISTTMAAMTANTMVAVRLGPSGLHTPFHARLSHRDTAGMHSRRSQS